MVALGLPVLAICNFGLRTLGRVAHMKATNTSTTKAWWLVEQPLPLLFIIKDSTNDFDPDSWLACQTEEQVESEVPWT